MISHDVLDAIHARLARELAPPLSPLRPFRVDGASAGWVDDGRAARLSQFTNLLDVRLDRVEFARHVHDFASRTAAMARMAGSLAADGLLTAWRDERYAVASAFGAAPWFELERAAARYFGVHTYAAHVNGLVRRHDGDVAMWIARRSESKAIDPGMLDNLVGGGIAVGQSADSTVVKEAFEEAGIDAPIAEQAIASGAVHLCRERADGIQRETVFVYDLWLAGDFVPACRDGEAADHRLVPLTELGAVIANDRGPDVVTADASLVILDCLLRLGTVASGAPVRGKLEALGHPLTDLRCALDG